jgi:hypothetical protein
MQESNLKPSSFEGLKDLLCRTDIRKAITQFNLFLQEAQSE